MHRSIRHQNDFFSEDEREVVDWPPCRPDLNFFETLRATIKIGLSEQTVSWVNFVEKVAEQTVW